MRSIARQSARVASRSRVRTQPQHQHARCFSRTAENAAADGRTPTDTPEHHHNHVQHKPLHTDDTQPAKATESDAEAGEDERKAKLLKTFRQRRREANSPTVPKPPPTPEWFLQHNVKLHVDTPKSNQDAKNSHVLRCVDNETGHILFTLPYCDESFAADSNGPLPPNYFSHKFETPVKSPSKACSAASPVSSQKPPSEGASKEVNPHALLRWAFLQADTGVTAAFALAKNPPQTSSQAVSRVDLSISCKDVNSHVYLDEVVEDLARVTGADLLRLDANDLAELSAEYVGQGFDTTGSFSNLAYDVYDGFVSASSRSPRVIEEDENEELDEEEQDDDEMSENQNSPIRSNSGLTGFSNLRRILMASRHHLANSLGSLKIGPNDILVGVGSSQSHKPVSPYAPSGTSDGVEFDIARLSALVESILDTPTEKRTSQTTQTPSSPFTMHLADGNKSKRQLDTSNQALWRVWRSSPDHWFQDVAGLLAFHVNRASSNTKAKAPTKLEAIDAEDSVAEDEQEIGKRTIVHIRDLRDLCNNRLGEAIIKRVVLAVQKRRRAGQEIVIVGTSACEPSSFTATSQGLDDFRDIRLPAAFNMSKEDQALFKPSTTSIDGASTRAPYSRILQMNLRNIRAMLNTMQQLANIDVMSESAQKQMSFTPSSSISKTVLTFNQVQQLVLTAIGLRAHAKSERINASHIGLAMLIEQKAEQMASDWAHFRGSQQLEKIEASLDSQSGTATTAERGQSRVEKVKKECNQHELRLLPGVVDPENIKTGFSQVHAPLETIDALKTLTSLSLTRPDAFVYGVLAASRLNGLLLYGPPGTGKTLLAKAVAKESGATVLEVSGSQVYEKYVGEGEKMVRAVFSLAKKLSPCIVFIDEADAIFGSRSDAGNRNTHREILNQFLREWDGMDLNNVFIMVATNRPFDLDDAVLRRLSRRLLVDLPVAKDRESILKIHLEGESLDDTVDLAKLAGETPLYSGSDLKNVCVSAALACVKEENGLAAMHKDDKDFKLPEKRVLTAQHFEKALKEISASISEDMGSLAAIRKFDEQFGDRRGRKKKANYGFGIGDVAVDENAAMVRQPVPPPPP